MKETNQKKNVMKEQKETSKVYRGRKDRKKVKGMTERKKGIRKRERNEERLIDN
jgi:hypothetical protein